MDSVITAWAFGFGGWIGVFGSTFLFLNVPHNYTLLLLLLSPWIGGISLYLLMYATHAWINVTVQVAKAMTQYEIIMAVLTSCIGVLIVAIARLIIDMERSHRTPAQAAAEESAAAAEESAAAAVMPDTPPTPETETETESSETEVDTDDENDSGSGSVTNSENDESNNDNGESDTETSTENTEHTSTTNDGNDGDDEDSNTTDNDALNEAGIEDSSSSSYENINTPQLSAIPKLPESPVPKIPDI